MPLSEYNPTDVIGVTRQHLQETMAALNWCYNYFSALDIADQAREGKAGVTPSRISITIERAFNHLEGYVAEPEEIG